jgi:NAD(P)-dependent dehydrogenase (short-subunit alcohol dehydrogenase family)
MEPAMDFADLSHLHQQTSHTEAGMSMAIENKAVLVTGANRGLGRALVAEALRRGARRVYAGTRAPLSDPDERVTPIGLDLTNAAQIAAAVDRVGSLDILINNAPHGTGSLGLGAGDVYRRTIEEALKARRTLSGTCPANPGRDRSS